MPLAWYSREDKDTYHICLNCGYRNRILKQNLVIETEDDVLEFTNRSLCEGCVDRVDNGKCRQSSSRIVVERTITALGWRLR